MSYPNSLVYTQFHPLAFIVKLRIELSMAKLIRKIATQKTDVCSNCTFELSTTRSGKGNGRHHAHGQCNHNGNKSTIESVPRRGSEALPKNQVMVHRTVMVDNERPPSRATGVSDMSAVEEGRSSAGGRGFDEDEDRILKQDGRW